MAKSISAALVGDNHDLFDRLRQVGIRKQVARSLSDLGEGTGKKAVGAARTAVAELRALADEIERRLPAEPPARAPSPAPTRQPARTPRGENKLRILEALRSGPKTASEIAGETGIAAGTVGSSLTKMAATGEVVKAARGYRLPN